MASDPTGTRAAGRPRSGRVALGAGALAFAIAASIASAGALPVRVASAPLGASAAGQVAPSPRQANVRPASAPDGIAAGRRVPTMAGAHVVAPAPPRIRNRLVSADRTLNTGVGWYSDCSGRTILSHRIAAIETCVHGRTYFVGHNPGVFTPLFHMGVGSIITWYDARGTAHRLRVVGIRTWHRFAGVPPLLPGATAEFQTCISADGTVDRLMDAAPA